MPLSMTISAAILACGAILIVVGLVAGVACFVLLRGENTIDRIVGFTVCSKVCFLVAGWLWLLAYIIHPHPTDIPAWMFALCLVIATAIDVWRIMKARRHS